MNELPLAALARGDDFAAFLLREPTAALVPGTLYIASYDSKGDVDFARARRPDYQQGQLGEVARVPEVAAAGLGMRSRPEALRAARTAYLKAVKATSTLTPRDVVSMADHAHDGDPVRCMARMSGFAAVACSNLKDPGAEGLWRAALQAFDAAIAGGEQEAPDAQEAPRTFMVKITDVPPGADAKLYIVQALTEAGLSVEAVDEKE